MEMYPSVVFTLTPSGSADVELTPMPPPPSWRHIPAGKDIGAFDVMISYFYRVIGPFVTQFLDFTPNLSPGNSCPGCCSRGRGDVMRITIEHIQFQYRKLW